MKRYISFILAVSCCFLSGCGGIYSNFREVEELLVLQTMGLDRIPGGVQLSLAAGAESSQGSAPVRLEGAGASISDAIDRAGDSSFEQQLFFTNIDSLLIGEDAARSGIGDYLSYVCRSPMLRIDIPVFIVRGGSAADCLIRSGDEQSSISDILNGIRNSLNSRGEGQLFSAAEILRCMSRHGSALVCALELSPASQTATGGGRGNAFNTEVIDGQDNSQAEGQLKDSEQAQTGGSGDSGAAEETKEDGGLATPSPAPEESPAPEGEESSSSSQGEKFSPRPAGLAVLKNNRLCAWIEPEDVLGVSFLLDKVGVSRLVLEDDEGHKVSVQINDGGSRVYPIWADDGSLLRLDIAAKAYATVLEAEGDDFDDEDYRDELAALLESSISEKISSVLQLSSKLGTDFLGLGGRVEQRDAKSWQLLGKSFSSLLPALELRLSVSAQLSHTNDIKEDRL